MNKPVKQTLFWTPRILGILFVLFVGMFSLDVFGEGAGFWQTLGAFLIHNIPAFFLLAALILGWRWEWVGALGFIAFGVWYVTFALARGLDATSYLLLTGIPLLIGALFLVGWFYRKQIRSRTSL
jgi:hypothetical protein